MKYTLVATVIGETFEWLVEMETDNPLVSEAARKGYQEWLQDAASTAKPKDKNESDYEGKATKSCRLRCLRERDAKIKDGTFKPGHGGGGSRQTAEEKGWIAFLKQINHKESGKEVNGKTLARARETLCRKWLLAVKTDEYGVTKDNVKEMAKQRLGEFTAWMETSNDGLIEQIRYYKSMESAKNIGLGF